MLWFLSKSVFSAVMIRTCFFKILRIYNVLPVMSAWTRPLLRKACPASNALHPLRTARTLWAGTHLPPGQDWGLPLPDQGQDGSVEALLQSLPGMGGHSSATWRVPLPSAPSFQRYGSQECPGTMTDSSESASQEPNLWHHPNTEQFPIKINTSLWS